MRRYPESSTGGLPMKKALCLILICALLTGCAASAGSASNETAVSDGRDRPSVSGTLQVLNGKLCGKNGEPVMLRGVSANGLPMCESFINETLFSELSRNLGANVFRIPVYTWGVGVVGYCTGGNQENVKKKVRDGVEYAEKADMYAIVDWHILQDGNPNIYIEEAKAFFAEMAETFKDHTNVIYEICNEPNGVEWKDIKRYAEEIIPLIRNLDPDSVIIVGTPEWSQRLDEAAADPLDYPNIMYTLHFYAASHKEELRSIARTASQNGLPVFATEYGVTASSGGFPRDLEEADRWIDFLEQEDISYCMWSFSKAPEACASIVSTCPKTKGFTPEDYNQTGQWLIETLKKH